MSRIILLPAHRDDRGNLTVIDDVLPFSIKRVYFIYGVDNSIRGKHRHHKTMQAAVCIQGSCKIYCNDNITQTETLLNNPEMCLLIKPEDWHEMYEFSNNAILMVFASEKYIKEDYIYEKY